MFGDVRAMQSAESITPSVATLVAALLPYFKIACNAVILAHKLHDGRGGIVPWQGCRAFKGLFLSRYIMPPYIPRGVFVLSHIIKP